MVHAAAEGRARFTDDEAGGSADERVRRLGDLLVRELEAEGLPARMTIAENGEPVLVVGEMKVYPRRLLEGQVAEAGDVGAVDLDWLARAHRAYFRNLRRFHPSLVTPARDGRRSGLADV